MKIGFDISQTGKNKAGCGYFAESLIKNLLEQDKDNTYFLYSAFGNTYWHPEHGKNTYRSRQNNCLHLLNKLSYQDSLLLWNDSNIEEEKLGNPDVIHANNFSSPCLKKARLVYTLYDLSFIDYPEFTSEENRLKCFHGVFAASLYADFIIAISKYSRDRFLEIFPHFPSERTKVIYLGSRFEQAIAETAVSNLIPNNFWLTVCTLEPRKNLRRTIKAYKHYLETYSDSKPLVLAGGKGWLEDDLREFINNLGLSKQVYLLGYVDDSTLKWLYKNCWAFIYPSIYEGFGLPVLEAMSLGTAVITSNTTSLPEVGGDAVCYVEPTNLTELTETFAKLMDVQLRDRLKAKSHKQAEKFSWKKTATEVLEIYGEVLQMPSRN
jgi:glycosyltransferase involved in cell wall biosynthesis